MKKPETRTVKIDAQAKINLALRITGKDANGYHPLETLFLRLELADTLTIAIGGDERTVQCDCAVGETEQNLAQRAARAYAEATGWPTGWKIAIEKRIPMGAGLGGGSADAGAVLRALNFLSSAPISTTDLGAIAERLGADVPFMAGEDVFAFAQGYGELLSPLPIPVARHVALAIPDFSIATHDAYTWLDEDGTILTGRPLWVLKDFSWNSIDRMVSNDFEPVVGRHHPVLPMILAALHAAGASASALTGSGSVVFGLFDDPRLIDRILLPPGVRMLRTSTATRVVQPRIMD